jgi:acyl-CoA thioester hydrolase
MDAPSRRAHTHTVRVFYGDTDQMGVAYYANYLRWFEMARNEYLRAAGCTYHRLESEGVILPVVEASCRYFSPARYDDLLELVAWIGEVGRVRVRFEYRVIRQGDAEPLAAGHTVHACLAPDSAPRRLPSSLLAAFERWEAGLPPA